MRFAEFYISMSSADQENYARRVGTTAEYIESHLLTKRRIPRRDKMIALAASRTDICAPFGIENKCFRMGLDATK